MVVQIKHVNDSDFMCSFSAPSFRTERYPLRFIYFRA